MRHADAIETLREPIVPVRPVARVPLVMVVDDSITMRKVSSRVLERQNYEVLTAKDGIDALEKLAERVPDVMLLDIEMPRMDGYELARSEEHTSELQSLMRISYAVFCLKKKKNTIPIRSSTEQDKRVDHS